MDAQEQRRLLELAAKAAGHQYAPHGGYIVVDGIPGNWNPLTDDGDALRLAEKCGLTVCMDGLGTVSACDERQRKEVFCTQSIKECGSRIEATRLAIVRAAAAIGEKMEVKP